MSQLYALYTDERGLCRSHDDGTTSCSWNVPTPHTNDDFTWDHWTYPAADVQWMGTLSNNNESESTYFSPLLSSTSSSSYYSPPPTTPTDDVQIKTEDVKQEIPSSPTFIMEPLLPLAEGRTGQSVKSEIDVVSKNLQSQAMAPPTQVPLRATHACKEMRRMMGSFRLNPFCVTGNAEKGDRGLTWCGEKPHALDVEPLMFEWELVGYDPGFKDSESGPPEPFDLGQLRPFSPEYEVEEEELQEEEVNDSNCSASYGYCPPAYTYRSTQNQAYIVPDIIPRQVRVLKRNLQVFPTPASLIASTYTY